MAKFRYQHIKSSVEGKAPTAAQIKTAEIGVNDFAGDEKLFIKNSEGEVVDFPRGYSQAYIDEAERVTAEALNDLNSRKLDASAYTPTDLSNYYTKDETSGKTEIQDALDDKADTATTYTKTEVDARDLWVSGTGENAIVQKGGNDTASGKLSVAMGSGTTSSGNYSVAEGLNTTASGFTSHAEGSNTKASGDYSHTEGDNTTASGNYSHAEGYNTTASGSSSHAEGFMTSATTNYSHAEGYHSLASGYQSHAEGYGTTASGDSSHAEGNNTTASGVNSHSEGNSTTASGINSHAEGSGTLASGLYSHSEGWGTTASSVNSHAEGNYTTASGNSSHAEGSNTKANNYTSHAEGYNTIASGLYSHSEGNSTTASGDSSHAEGNNTSATTYQAHAEGGGTLASGVNSHAEGQNTTASGQSSHAEGNSTKASSDSSHAEGNNTTASGVNSHAEGQNTTASGAVSHAEGYSTIASGVISHAEGYSTTASGVYSHAEGSSTTANGLYSHAEGNSTIANNQSEHASGQYNVSSSASTTFGDSGNTLFSVGNGTANDARHNAFEIRQNGDIYLSDGTKLQDAIDITIDQVIDSGTSASTDAVSTSAVYGFVTSYTPSITVDQDFSNTASTNPISTKAVYSAVTDNELVWTNAFVTLSGVVSSHTENTDIHVTAADKDNWDAKLDASAYTPTDLTNYYTKSETSGATEISTALADKADTATTYTKTEVDERDLWVGGTGLNSVVQKGGNNTASGLYSHAEGRYTKAGGDYSHAEGNNTTASGDSSHAEGRWTKANGGYGSHAEGYYAIASGTSSHAEGQWTRANGDYSHAEGYNTIANNQSEHASGQYNVSSKASSTFGDSGNTLFSVGNGTADNAKHNAFEIRQNGDIYLSDGTKLQDAIDITIDQVIDSGTSASTNAVATKAVYDALIDKADTSDIPSVDAYADSVKYNSTSHYVEFYHGTTAGTKVFEYDASPFIIDGMVDDVRIENGNLVIDFNTASGKQDISIPLTDIFDPSNYYDKDDIDDLVGSGFTLSSITDVIIENEEIVSAALTDLDDRKLDASAYTPTDLSNYYTKSEVDARDLWVSGTGTNSVAQKGGDNIASGNYSLAEGYSTSATSDFSHTEGYNTLASENSSHAEGSNTIASGHTSHAEGQDTEASGDYSHAEGSGTIASGESSHAEGQDTEASGDYSHAEGDTTIASGESSHAEGSETLASGDYSHAEGNSTIASGESSHAEGESTSATNVDSHAEGYATLASGNSSHAEGWGTVSLNKAEHASGQFNVSSSSSSAFGDSGNTLFSVGNGTANDARHNAFEIRQNGDIYITSGNSNIKLQDYIGSVETVTAITPSNSGSTEPIATKVVAENELVMANALNDLESRKLDASAYTTTNAVTSGSTDVITSGGVYAQMDGIKLKKITQSAYDALVQAGTVDANTLYVITD